MNKFNYNIYKEVYNEMIFGKKKIEYRLLNKKTESIKVGDEIEFKVLEDETKYIIVKVLDKYIYKNIDELWQSKETSKNILSYTKDELINTFYNIFGKQNVDNSQIVGIKFEIKEIG